MMPWGQIAFLCWAMNPAVSRLVAGNYSSFICKANFEAQSLYNMTVAVTDTTLKPAPNATPDATVNFT
jgi:hypothetical protein